MRLYFNTEDRPNKAESVSNCSFDVSALSGKTSMQLAIESIVIPASWYTVRENLQNRSFVATFDNSTTKTIYLVNDVDTNYSGSPSLSEVFNAVLSQLNGNGQTFTISLNSVTAKCVISSDKVFSLNFATNENAKLVFGLVNNTSTAVIVSGSYIIKSTNVCQVTPMTHVLLKSNLNALAGNYNSESQSISNTVAIIPVLGNVSAYSWISHEFSNLDFRSVSGRLDSNLKLILCDQNDNPLDLNGMNYSVVLFAK